MTSGDGCAGSLPEHRVLTDMREEGKILFPERRRGRFHE